MCSIVLASRIKTICCLNTTARSCLFRCKRCRLLMVRKSISFVKDLIRYLNFIILKFRMNVVVAKVLGYRRYYVS